ncbi:NAD(P)-binding protein [Bimuria novae-zelandiae CBS 107.79]|uniref:NAD(P)-binding protein n=1 Tax=Bimuria novae-zelandiae CBS 107.79 TaxID=1447943 RepID=A0A6A5VN78_9PLEO|nr:NAD(P)-binding protein [Bimuria novae-zelandiae CBS 107.79]
MSSYVVVGASRGIGWGFVEYLSADASNTVVGIVRNSGPTIERVKSEFPDRKNITILQADLDDETSLQKAAADTAKITGGSLDYLIGVAAYLPMYDQLDGPAYLLSQGHEDFAKQFHQYMNTNVLAQIFLYEAYLTLLLKGKAKKVLSLSSAMGDLDLNREQEMVHAILYSTSKAALNMVNVKYGVQYKKDGVLFLSICPGFVLTDTYNNLLPEQKEKAAPIIAKFYAYAPNFAGKTYTPVESVQKMLSVLEKCSIENGDSGKYLSHLGTNKRWLP